MKKDVGKRQMRSKVPSLLATWVAPLWPVTIVGAALGAAVGSLVVTPVVTYSATSVVALEVPIGINQLMTGMQQFSDSIPDYLGGELTYLNSEGFRGAVGVKLGRPASAPEVIATRSGKSDLFTLAASAQSAADARRVVDAAVATYMDHVREVNTDRYKSAVAAIDAVVPVLEQNKQHAGIVATPPELAALYNQRAALQVQLQRDPGVIVVEPTADKGSTTPLPLGPIGGGAVGGLLALGAALIWRSRRGIITSPKQIGDQLAPCPVVPLGESDIDQTIARSIYAVLPPPRTGRIVVVGASANSQSQAVADYVSFAASEHGPVKDVDLSDTTNSSGPDPDDITIVVNAGPWASSSAVTDVIDDANQIIIVARLNIDTRQSVAELCQAMSQQSAPFCVVCVKG